VNRVPRPAVFLDRDGTLNAERGPIGDATQVALLPGVAAALQQLAGAGFRLVVLTNQSGVARGSYDQAALARVHARLAAETGGTIAGWLHCPHLPEAVGPYGGDCDCRKPRDGLLRQALALWPTRLEGSYVIGDSARDLAFAQAWPALTRILVASGKPVDAVARALAQVVVADLPAAADWILARPR
jgi:D-glycero-D-manno-heptose 1,7-bisphosphate phosphatase